MYNISSTWKRVMFAFTYSVKTMFGQSTPYLLIHWTESSDP